MDDEAVARRMKLARLGRRLTQREVGERLGKTTDAVKQMETGRGVGRETLEAFAKALSVSFSYLSLGITQASDIDVIVEGARQLGWDEAVRRMRESLDVLDARPTKRTARPLKPGEAHVVPPTSSARKRGA